MPRADFWYSWCFHVDNGLQELSTSRPQGVVTFSECACSRHVACDAGFVTSSMTWRGGQSDHSGKTALTPSRQAGKTFERVYNALPFLQPSTRIRQVSVCVTRSVVTNMLCKQLVVQLGLSQGASAIAHWVPTLTDQAAEPCAGTSEFKACESHHHHSLQFGIDIAKRLGFREMVTDTRSCLAPGLHSGVNNRELKVWIVRSFVLTGQDLLEMSRAHRSLRPRERNQPTHRWHVGPTGSSTQ